MNPPVVVYGPPGCGKSLNENKLVAIFSAQRVVDFWDGESQLSPGDLALTQLEPPYKQSVVAVAYDVLSKARLK